MDERIKEIDNCPWNRDEIIPSEAILYRYVHFGQASKEEGRRFPNDSHFILKPGHVGLSFNWDKYCDLPKNFILKGLTFKENSDQYFNHADYLIFQIPAAVMMKIPNIDGIKFDPIFQGNPSQRGQPNNKSHAQLYFDEDNLGVRTILSSFCKDSSEALCKLKPKTVNDELEALRQMGNETPYHKDWDFDQ